MLLKNTSKLNHFNLMKPENHYQEKCFENRHH